MTILVTGATGGLASAVIERFAVLTGEPVVASGRMERDRVSGASDYARCDVSDRDAVRALVGRLRPRAVLHLAGSFRNDLTVDTAVNALSAGWIMEALAEAGCESRVVLIGSAAEYGVIPPGENPVPECRPLRPVSVYGLTKAMQTQIAGYFAAARGADVVVARLFNVHGPGLSERLFAGRAQRQIDAFARGEIDRLEFGSLEAARDYLGLDEAADLIARVFEHGARGEVYNVGSGRPVTMRALLDAMLARAGLPDAPVVERPVEGRAAVIDLPCIYADVAKLGRLPR
ncbi:MAG: NAD(P)-dependent oxidoreductase [Burkholderiaceae bacterium]|nr:NAD(P)-dependent oxidoreductase [Burkholderiales bacterium]MCZ8337175.1 NAD(P)-dependent oxidoreductase [Burkholderiaceae bacterium]